MCGIVGVIAAYQNGFTTDEINAFKDLIFMDALRGIDATGIMFLDKDNDLTICKEASPSWEFLNTKEWRSARSDIFQGGRFAFAHNRAGTRGSNIDANAHPFIAENIVLMQNGTYRGDHTKHKKVDVDSEACAHAIANAESIEKGLQSINAAYAFVWYDTKTHVLHLIRNDERPLWMAKTKTGSIMFASEIGMVYAACTRNNLTIEGQPLFLPSGHLYTYDFSDKKKFYSETKELNIKYVPPVFKAQVTQTNRGGRHARNGVANYSRTDRLTICQAMEWCGNGLEKGTKSEAAHDKLKIDVVTAKVAGESFLVEGFDMCKLYQKDKNDSHYYMFGKIVDPSGVFDGENVCWIAEGEQEALINYLLDSMFTVTLDYAVGRPESMENTTSWVSCIVTQDVQVACNLPKEYTHAQTH